MINQSSLLLFHVTHVDNLGSIVLNGLRCDSNVTSSGIAFREIANREIKAARRRRSVPVAPWGYVADYVPFYFAPRSPFLYAVAAEERSIQNQLIYLVSSTDLIVKSGRQFVYSNRNASLRSARFATRLADIDLMVSWEVMEDKYFFNTPQKPDRRQIRMAEFLVHRSVPWSALLGVATYSEASKLGVIEELGRLGIELGFVATRTDWYF